MWKKTLLMLVAPLLLCGCTATFTNLSPQNRTRSPDNSYPVEVAFNSRQQSLRWDSIKPMVVVGGQALPLRQTVLMTNRWEGFVPVGPGTNIIYYHYQFDFQYNEFGGPQADSAKSPEYKLQIHDQ